MTRSNSLISTTTMLSSFNLILLCGMCSMVTSVTFFWSHFGPIYGAKETLADYSKVKLSTFIGKGKYIRYLRGPVEIKTELDDSYMISYTIRRVKVTVTNIGELPITVDRYSKTVTLCDFADHFYKACLLPMAEYHTDFPPSSDDTICPLRAGTYHFFKIEDHMQLSAPSELPRGAYILEVTFLKDDLSIGGFEGRFFAFNQTKE